MLYLLLSFFLYAFNNVVWKWAVEEEKPIYLINRRAIFTFLIATLALVCTQRSPFSFVTHPKFIYVVVADILGTTGLILMVSFLKQGSLTRLSYYTFLGIAINAGLSFMMERIPFSPKLGIASMLLLLGYSIFVWDERRKMKVEPILLTQHILLVLMTICFSLSTVISWRALKYFQPLPMMVTQEFMVLTVTSIAYWFIKPKKENPKRYGRYALMALIIMAAVFTGLLGLKYNNPFITSIGGISIPLLTVAFGAVFLKEKVSWLQLLSFATIVAGEILLF
ncbi:MAG: DMT family transporter [Bacteroidia bacterium]|nr:DMT family transporter [Bacteroidia bacterium]